MIKQTLASDKEKHSDSMTMVIDVLNEALEIIQL